MNYNKIAAKLDYAAFTKKATRQISLDQEMNLDEAYAIQSISMGRRLRRGEKIVGLKLGFTSKAKMEQMGVHDMIWGRLTDKMQYENDGTLKMQDFIHPRAEPEIAFLVKKKIEHEITREKVLDYIEAVAVAIEIIDSRFEHFKFSLSDVIADNCSSAGFAIGDWHREDWKVDNRNIALLVNSKVEQKGNTNAILGDPIASFLAASRLYAENGLQIEKGEIILAGAATSAIYINSGEHIRAEAEGLGSVSLHVV